MNPEMKKKIDEANARTAAARAKIEAKRGNADFEKRVATAVAREIDARAKAHGAPATGETKAFSPKPQSDPFKIGIDGNRFSLVKALLARKDFEHQGRKAFENHRAEYERDALEAYYAVVQRETGKTMTFGDEAFGGFLVPPEVRAPIDALRSATWLDKLPVDRLTGLTYSPVIIPRVDSDNTSYWVAEGTATTTSDGSISQISFNPKVLANGMKLSLQLMRKSPGTAEQIARRSIAASMQRKLELGLIEGATGGVVGLDNITGIGSVSFSGADGDTKQVKVNQMILELIQDNVVAEGGMFLMSEKVWANLVGILHIGAGTTATNRAASKKFNDFAYVDPQGQKWLAGYKVVTTNNLTVSTTGKLYFGRWDYMHVADWGAAEMAMTTEGQTLALARQALITTFQEVDQQVSRPEAFSTGTAYTVALS